MYKESQFSLAIVTVVLTSSLLLLIAILYIICLCNCKLVSGLYDTYNIPYPQANLNYRSDIYTSRIQTADATPGHTILSPHSADINIAEFGGEDNRHYITPTAPPAFTQYTSGIYNTSIAASTNSLDSAYNPQNHDLSINENYRAFESPPPSYNEVMENDPMETPL